MGSLFNVCPECGRQGCIRYGLTGDGDRGVFCWCGHLLKVLA